MADGGFLRETLKDVGRKLWDIALKLSESSCSCGWEGECRACGSLANLDTAESSNKREDHESKEVVT